MENISEIVKRNRSKIIAKEIEININQIILDEAIACETSPAEAAEYVKKIKNALCRAIESVKINYQRQISDLILTEAKICLDFCGALFIINTRPEFLNSLTATEISKLSHFSTERTQEMEELLLEDAAATVSIVQRLTYQLKNTPS